MYRAIETGNTYATRAGAVCGEMLHTFGRICDKGDPLEIFVDIFSFPFAALARYSVFDDCFESVPNSTYPTSP